jgi:gamma-glutamylaminecyclotransferase
MIQASHNPVFVYGTLKRGFPYHDVAMKGQAFVGVYRTCQAFPLVICGRWFSPIVIAEPGVGHRVLGELFLVGDGSLARLDEFEGVRFPDGYRRISIDIENRARSDIRAAWAYVKDRDRTGRVRSSYLRQYALDRRYVIAPKRS